jgi:hypothetical protein
LFSGLDGLAIYQFENGLDITIAYWLLWRANTIPAQIAKKSLHEPILQRMEADDSDTTTWSKYIDGSLYSLLNRVQFPIYRDTNGLKTLRRRMNSPFPLKSGGN